jgi:hypothetical protein
MSLLAGAQLGPYEVVDLLGAGAMGEVYRARDTRLRRQVALKVLPASVSDDPGRLQRFQQEARAAGALNHPNIIAIHDIGCEGGSSYVVSELLEGETLRERIAGHALPPRKVLEYATQIARGLAAAHERGIVHRDLKPENVFITRDGSVKILDFGLAKLDPRGSLAQLDAMEESTATSLTEPGTVLGTVGYMSPEQVRGQEADHRSDIFSFGAIFYEMLTGRRAFRGKSAIETMNAILKEEPRQISDVNPDLPAGLERVVTHCLEKHPEERFQSARDLAFDLEALSHVSTFSGRRLRLMESPWRRARPALIAAGLLALPLAGFVAARLSTSPQIPTYHRLTFRRGLVGSARFAPSGEVVYTAAWDGGPSELYSTRPEAPDSRRLDVPMGRVFAVSRTGEMGMLLSKDGRAGTLARVPLAGGAAREVLERVQDADASPDGSTFAIVRDSSGRTRLEYPVGTMLYETTGHMDYPRISPDGQRVALLEHPLQDDDRGSVVLVERDGTHRVLSGDWASLAGLAWRPDGREVWFTGTRVGADSALLAVDLAGRERAVTRAPGRLILADIAADGRVLMQRASARMEIKARRGGETADRDLSWFDYSAPVDLSADGKTVLFYESGEGGGKGYGIYARGTDGAAPVRLGEGRAMALTRDGRWALTLPLDAPSRLVMLPTGAGQPRVIRDPSVEQYQWATLFPDDTRALVIADVGGRAGRVFIEDLATGALSPALPDGVTLGGTNPISPDGTLLIGYAPESKTALLYPVGGGDARPIRGLQEGYSPLRWTSDGKGLFLRKGRVPALVYRLDLATGQQALWTTITPPDLAGIPTVRFVLPHADGSYVYTYMRSLSELYVVDGLR